MVYDIPGTGLVELNNIILDLNGTLSIGGRIVDGVKSQIARLQGMGYHVVFFTGNTRNDADGISEFLDIPWREAKTAADKVHEAKTFNLENTVSIGNGRIDLELTKAVRLGIVTLQAEGVHVETLLAADVVVPSITDALDLLIDTKRLVATLRK
jgi:soluble P-type ATPase